MPFRYILQPSLWDMGAVYCRALPPILSAFSTNTKWAAHLVVDIRDRTYWGASYLSVWFGREYVAMNQAQRVGVIFQQRARFAVTYPFCYLQ
jgi:hypothetical protein